MTPPNRPTHNTTTTLQIVDMENGWNLSLDPEFRLFETDSSDPELVDPDFDDEDDVEEDEEDLDCDSLDCGEYFQQYRTQCEKWLNDDDHHSNQQGYIDLLQKMVKNLLDQNECLVMNIMEIKKESANRINELRRNLDNTAGRTEEVMLALQSHELCLKNFVQQHCCQCCDCDLRLMQFRLCHGSHCDHNHHHPDHRNDGLQPPPTPHPPSLPTLPSSSSPSSSCIPSRCWSYGHLWTSVLHQSSHWYADRELCERTDCLHNLNSERRFLNLVDLIDAKIHQLENENETLKKENQMIRELNSLLSCRNGPPLLLTDIANRTRRTSSNIDDHLQDQPPPVVVPPQPYIISCLDSSISLSPRYSSKTNSNSDSDSSYDRQLLFGNVSLNSSSDSSPEIHHADETTTTPSSLNTFFAMASRDCFEESCDWRQDNDSGCSTDLIPSQTDIQSLLALSDLDDDIGIGGGGTMVYPTTITNLEEQMMIRNIISGSMNLAARIEPNREIMFTEDNDTAAAAATTTTTIPPQRGEDGEDNHLIRPLLEESNAQLEMNTIENFKNRVQKAERLIPKLYNKTLYYMNQRNLLLRQFRRENRAREQCKKELSALTECLLDNLKYVETKTIKNQRNNQCNGSNNILCS